MLHAIKEESAGQTNPQESSGNISDQNSEAYKRRKREIQSRNTFKGTIRAKEATGYLDLGSAKKKETKLTGSLNYDSKEVSSAVLQAKTSVSAGKAVIKAKRKVLELKRQLAKGGDDAKEIMVALSHAKAIERVAKKKKHHLELEELVEKTQQTDEKLEELKGEPKEGSGGGFTNFDFIEEAQQEIEDARDEILEEISPEEMMAVEACMEEIPLEEIPIEEISVEEIPVEPASGDMEEFSEEMTEAVSEALSNLDEAQEMLEELEVVDPHMSKEDLKKLKIKHRSSEEKDIVKADMSYLRDMIKHALDQQMQSTGASQMAGLLAGATAAPSPVFMDVSV